jgi:hypothetical protein
MLLPMRLLARDRRRFQGLHRFSLTINDSNRPGNLLSLKSQFPQIEQMAFRHSFGNEKQVLLNQLTTLLRVI